MEIKVEQKFSYFLISINEIPHIYFKTEDFLGIQIWVDGREKWVIEYYFSSGTKIMTEYNSKEKFEFILNEIKKIMWGF